MTDANGHPLPLYYTKNTSFTANGDGSIATVTLRLDKGEAVPSDAHVYVIVNTYPVSVADFGV